MAAPALVKRNARVDTNIWFYALSAGDEAKRLATNRLPDSLDRPAINSQVIRELCINLLRKSSYDEAAIQELATRCIVIVMLLLKTSVFSCAHPNCANNSPSVIGIA